MRARAVLFDLFGTLVRFNVRVPTVRLEGAERRSTMPWLVDAFRRELPRADFEKFLEAITAVTVELIRARPPEYLEVPSRLRFERALVRMGMDEEVAAAHAGALSLAHMAHIASSVELPDGHVDLLDRLAARLRLAVVSNFDHGATARGILDRFGLTRSFEVIVISEDFGRRKPHPAIFEHALERLDVPPPDAIYVGDSADDDIGGGKAAGLRVVWINPADRSLPAGTPAPDAVVRALPELLDLVD